MAQMEVRHTLSYSTTWAELLAIAKGIGVPESAKFRFHKVAYASPVDPGYEEVIWTWEV